MFTGIVQAKSFVKRVSKKNKTLILRIEKPNGWKIKPGDSISADGVCLTVKKADSRSFLTQLMPETLSKTTFGKNVPALVNLEPSLKFSDLLGGHLVSGHVDAVGRIESIKVIGSSKVYKIGFPKQFSRLIADKGSVAVDGVSLTVVKAGKNSFTVSLVDYTLKHTVLGIKRSRENVNLEFDVLAKYVSRLLNKS